MMNYRNSRRSFLAAVGGSLIFTDLLRKVEGQAQAQEEGSPKRLLVTHRGVGTIPQFWVPQAGATPQDYTTSRILTPFEAAGLREDMVVLYPLAFRVGGPGGGHEKGTVVMMTGTPTEVTRTGQTEQDDPAAAGPSADQLILNKSEALKEAPFGSLYALCDDRIDFQEISTRCMRYSTERREIRGVQRTTQENLPMRPVLKPLELFTNVFGSAMPDGQDPAAIERVMAARKSVLDFSKRELTRLRTLVPQSSLAMMESHEQAIRDLEKEFAGMTGTCDATEPEDIEGGVDDGGDHDDYGSTTATRADQDTHKRVGELHQATLIAALKCDLTRVALFQWSPGTNHVAFQGMWPDDPNAIYMHHPTSHKIGDNHIDAPNPTRPEVEFLVRVEEWYNTRQAEFMTKLKTEMDINGQPLLDNTIVPYVTEVGRATHRHTEIPVILFGGKNLGVQGGQFITPPSGLHNDMWITVAQALGVTMEQLQGERGFMYDSGSYSGPIEGILGPVPV